MSHIKLGIVRLGKAAGKVKYTIIDEDDISLIENYAFEPRVDVDPNGMGARVYAYIYPVKEGNANAQRLHTVLWIKYRGVIEPGYRVTHKNGITVDNRLDNLELSNDIHHPKISTSCHGNANLYYTAICQLPDDLVHEQSLDRGAQARAYDANGVASGLECERETLYECRYPPCSNIEQLSGQFAVCGRCRSSRYCGNICQQKDWSSHRKHCCRAQVAPPKPNHHFNYAAPHHYNNQQQQQFVAALGGSHLPLNSPDSPDR